MMILKRDNTKVAFNPQKIIQAIEKAFLDVDGEIYEHDTAQDIALEIGKKVAISSDDNLVTVEQIQDWVEDYLMRSERTDVARAYVRYRYKREVARSYQHDFIDTIREKLGAENVQNQNANVDEYSFGGRTGEASSIVTKKLALDYIISKQARYNHENNIIYIHDLDSYYIGSHNCLSVPFDKLLAKGFNTRQTDVRPAGSVNTACQLVAVIFQLQSLQQFGGVSATHIDWTMVPYIRKSFYKHFIDGLHYIEDPVGDEYAKNLSNDLSIDDDRYKQPYAYAYQYAMDMTEKETRQAVEGLYHNLNTLQSRSGELIARQNKKLF